MVIIKKIDNSKKAAVKKGKYKDPGAKFYDKILDSVYAKGGVIPTDSKELNDSIRQKTYMHGTELLSEVYLICNKDIKNSPYGKTPFSQSGCKYPHHVISGDQLVISIPLLKHAYETAWRHCELDKDSAMKRHLMGHLKELGLECVFHHGQLYWNDYDKKKFYGESLEYFNEKSHGSLKYCYRIGVDLNTGKQVAVQFKIDPSKITSVGNKDGYEIAHLLNNPNDLEMSKKVDDKINNLRARGEFDQADELESKLNKKMDLLTKDARNKALETVKKNIKKVGHIDHITDDLIVDKIFQRDGKSINSVRMIPMLSEEIKIFIRYIENKYDVDDFYISNPSSYAKDGCTLSYKKLFSINIINSEFVDFFKNSRANYESYKVGEYGGKDKYKTTKLLWDTLYDFMKFTKSPAIRGNLTNYRIKGNHKEYNGYNKPRLESYIMEANFNDIFTYIMEDTGIDLFGNIGLFDEGIHEYTENYLRINDTDILEYFDEGWDDFLNETLSDNYFTEASTKNIPESKESFKKRWHYNSKNSTIKYEDREFKIDLNTDVEEYKFKFKVFGKEEETSDKKNLCAAYGTSDGPVIVLNNDFWKYSDDHQDAIILHEMGHIVCHMTPKPFPKSIKELIQRIKKAIQRLIARIRMGKYVKGIHGDGYKEIEADLWAAKRISPEIMKSLIKAGNDNEIINKKGEIIKETKKVNPKERFKDLYNKNEKVKAAMSFDEFYEQLIELEVKKTIEYYTKDPSKNKDTAQRIAALNDKKLFNSKYFKTESALSGDGTHLTSGIWEEIGDKTPEALYKWMYDNIKYDKTINGWKLKSPEEVYKLKMGNCHDQSLFSSLLLHSLNFICGQLFFVECNMAMDNPDGNAHTLTWYRETIEVTEDNDSRGNYYNYYWLETAWETQLGIHGPYNDMEEMKRAIIDAYNKDDDINSHDEKFDVLAMSDITSHQIGMGYNKYIYSWKNGMKEVQRKSNLEESVSMDITESIHQLLDEISCFVENNTTHNESNISAEIHKEEEDLVPIFGIVKSYSHSEYHNDGTEKSDEEKASIKFDKIIHALTRGDNYSHALVSFDISLKEMYSYEDAGFVIDNIMEKDSWLGTKSFYICVMFVKKEDRDNMKRYIETLKEHPEQTKYAMGNLIKAYIATPTKTDKRFVCSSFTGYIMQCANPKNLHRDYSRLRPDDITILPRAFYVANVIDRNDFVKNFEEIKSRVQTIYNDYKDDIADYNNHLPKIMLSDKMQELKTIDKILDWIVNKLA